MSDEALGVDTELGLGLDVAHLFGPTISHQIRKFCSAGCAAGPLDKVTISTTSFGFDAMLRFPLLKSDKFPKGQVQPYLTVGPTVFVAHANDTTNFLPRNQSDTATNVGVKLGAGVRWQFHKNIAAFGEYRFMHFDPSFNFTDTILGSTDFAPAVNTHAILGGVSFRFP